MKLQLEINVGTLDKKNAVLLSSAELDNLGIVTGGDVKTDFTIDIMASSQDGQARRFILQKYIDC